MQSARVALITGTSRGIGRGLVERFLADGYRVVGCSRGEGAAIAGDYEHARLDVGDENAVRRWVRSVGRSHGRIDVAVNNAGISAASPALVTPGATAAEVMRVNFLGAFLVGQEVARLMVRQRHGRIVNIASVASAIHAEGASVYAASKSALVEYSKVLARELADSDVTVNVVAPSLVATDMLERLGERGAEAYRRALTIKRNCRVEEVAHVVAFLASPESACLTGQVIHLGLVV